MTQQESEGTRREEAACPEEPGQAEPRRDEAVPAAEPERASNLEKVLMWLFKYSTVTELRRLPGLNPNPSQGEESYLLKGISQESYGAFAMCPPANKVSKRPIKNLVTVRLLALYNFWWRLLSQDEKGREVALPHPKSLGVSPDHFVSMYMPEKMIREFHVHTTFSSTKQPVARYEGKPKQFKRFFTTVKAAAANTSPELVRCIENQVYAESMSELNNVLYNWLLAHIDKQTMELHFIPHEGNGYMALRSLASSQPVVNYEKAEREASKAKLLELKCNGVDLAGYVQDFQYLAKMAEIQESADLVRCFFNGFSKTSPYWDKAQRLREKGDLTLGGIVDRLYKYYHTNLSAKEASKDDEGEGKGNAQKPPKKSSKKRSAAKTAGSNGKTGNGGDEQGNKTPRLSKEDYATLSNDQRNEFRTTGKIKGYDISAHPDAEGNHALKPRSLPKSGKSNTAGRRMKDDTSDGGSSDTSADEKYYRDVFGFD